MKRIVCIGMSVGSLLLLAACQQPAKSSKGDEAQPIVVTAKTPDEGPVRATVPVPAPDLKGKKPDLKTMRADVKPVQKLGPLSPVQIYDSKTRELAALAKAYDVYFAVDSKENLLKSGSFEEAWPKNSHYPEGWGGLPKQKPPLIRRGPGFGKVGDVAVHAFGLLDSDVSLKSLEVPPAEELRGKEVLFGVWIKTPHPDKVVVRIIDNWKTYYSARPTVKNNWQLVIVKGQISDDSKSVNCAITLTRQDPRADALFDGAAFVVIK